MSSREAGPTRWRHWSGGETRVAPLQLRRFRGTRASSLYRRRLPDEDWRLVAAAVNAHRASASAATVSGLRSVAQCQARIGTLLRQRPAGPSCPSRRLRALLHGADGVEEDDLETATGLAGVGWRTVPRKLRSGFSAAAAVVARLAGVYEQVEMAALEVERERLKMETERYKNISCNCNLTEAAGH